MERTTVAVILAAGVGSRLRPLTDDRPKALVEVGGESILARAIRQLAEYGVQKVVLATGYREDALKRALSSSPVPIVYCRNPKYETTQNSVSLALCKDAIGGDGFFKLDGDVLFEASVLPRLDEKRAPLVAAVDRGRELDAEAMKVRVEEQGRIVAFHKDMSLSDAFGESIGIERIRKDAGLPLFAALERAHSEGRHGLYYEDVYNELIDDGLHAAAADVSDLPWVEVDTAEDLQKAETWLARRT